MAPKILPCTLLVLLVAALPLWGAAGASQGQAPAWAQIDALTQAKDFDGAHALLKLVGSGERDQVDYLWRMARHHFNVSDNTTDEEVIERELHAGFDQAQKALAADSTNASAHGYYAILIGRVGQIEGTKQKIINSYAVRDHTLRAIELDPTNDAWQHVMGQWHFTLADLSWLERNIASLIYAAPPQASFEEAVGYFKRAGELDSDDVRHFLWLGKSQLELDNESAARASLETAVNLPPGSDSDTILQDEARELLAKL